MGKKQSEHHPGETIIIRPADEGVWVDLQEASRILGGLSRQNIYYYVNTRKLLRSRSSTNQRDHEYNLADLKRIQGKLTKVKIEAFSMPKDVVVDWLTPDELGTILNFDYQVFPEHIQHWEYGVMLSWLKRNPYLLLGVFDHPRGEPRRCLSYLQVLPLIEESLYVEILAGHKQEVQILPKEIMLPDAPTAPTLLCTAAAALEKRYFHLALRTYLSFWAERAPRQSIHRVYALARTPAGKRFATKARFAPLYISDGKHAAVRLEGAFVLDREQEDSPLVQQLERKIELYSQ